MISQTGTLQNVTVNPLGSALAVAASVSDTVLAVDDTVEFSEKGGLLLLAGVEYVYLSTDSTAETITLAAPVSVAGAVGDEVSAMSATGSQAREMKAHVEQGDRDAEPVACSIPTDLAGYFVEGEEQAGSFVQFVRDGRGSYRVVSRPGSESSLDGSVVWNPYVKRRKAAATLPNDTWVEMQSWLDELSNGVVIEANGSVTITYPGFYAVNANPGFAISGSGLRYARILIDGLQVGYMGIPGESSATTFVNVQAHEVLAEGANVTLEVKQNSGASLDMSVGAGRSPFALYRVSV